MTERNKHNECYACKHKRSIKWNAHIRCAKPDDNMYGDVHGVKNGWFHYPFNFDPVWKKVSCRNFEVDT